MSSAGSGIAAVRHLVDTSQIQSELFDSYGIKLSADSLARYIRHYQIMLAARRQDPAALRRRYESVAEIILAIPRRDTKPSTS